MNNKEISLIEIISALYSALVIGLAPISFLPIQIRIADAMLPLSIIFGMPAIIGLTLGTIVANVFGGLGFVDIIGGGFANLVAAYVAWKVGSLKIKYAWITAVVLQIIIVGTVVGIYLAVLFEIPILISISNILISSTVAVGIIGYSVLKIVSSNLNVLEDKISDSDSKNKTD